MQEKSVITRMITTAAGVYAPGHLGELTQIVDFALVDAVLEETGAREKRLRLLHRARDPAAIPRAAAPRAPHTRMVPIGYHAGMPALNVTFTDEEMEAVRASAAAEGKSLKQYLHDLALREQQRAVFVRYATAFGEQHRGEFDEAFPDEVPQAGTRHGGAAAA